MNGANVKFLLYFYYIGRLHKMNNLKINFTTEDAGKYWLVCKFKGVDAIKQSNTERFAKILANNWAILNYDNYRIPADKNPHLAEQLEAERCNNWRVDDISYSCDSWRSQLVSKAGTYLLNTTTGELSKKLERGEYVCKHCSEIITKAEQVGAYCIKCLKRDGLITRYGYHDYNGGYKIYEKVDTEKVPVFGCEIERDYKIWGDFSDNLKNALLDVFKTFHEKEIQGKKPIQREFVFMRDGSLNEGGCEWITFPHTYKWYKANANKLQECIEIFNKYNFGNSNDVGNHIHINNDYFKGKNKLGACKLALIFSMYWDEFKAIAKRTNTSYTTKPTHKKDDDVFTLAEKTLNNWHNHSIAVNTQHTKTTELRLWGGVDNVSDLLLFLDITQALTIYARKKSIESIQKSKFVDTLKYLTDKAEHIAEIVTRLTDKGITAHNTALKQLIKGDN